MGEGSFVGCRKTVALLAEGVDRNYDGSAWAAMTGRSPSSRRAWIEIGQLAETRVERVVALLAEGVDRNPDYIKRVSDGQTVALLAEGVDRNNRCVARHRDCYCVALLAEGVDRNFFVRPGATGPNSRPPRGGRG